MLLNEHLTFLVFLVNLQKLPGYKYKMAGTVTTVRQGAGQLEGGEGEGGSGLVKGGEGEGRRSRQVAAPAGRWFMRTAPPWLRSPGVVMRVMMGVRQLLCL